MQIPLDSSIWEGYRVTAPTLAQPHITQAPVLCVIHALYSWTLKWKDCVPMSSLYPTSYLTVWLIFQMQFFGFTPLARIALARIYFPTAAVHSTNTSHLNSCSCPLKIGLGSTSERHWWNTIFCQVKIQFVKVLSILHIRNASTNVGVNDKHPSFTKKQRTFKHLYSTTRHCVSDQKINNEC